MGEFPQFLYLGPLGVALILFAVSAIYFYANRDQPMPKRLLGSCHGVLLAGQMTPIVARDLMPAVYGGWLSYVYYGSLIFGLMAVAYSLRHCARPWYFHLLHVWTLLYGALANIYGYQANLH